MLSKGTHTHAAGSVEAAEVVQLFVAPSATLLQTLPANTLPKKALKGFARVTVKPGSHEVVELPLSSKDFHHAVPLGKQFVLCLFAILNCRVFDQSLSCGTCV